MARQARQKARHTEAAHGNAAPKGTGETSASHAQDRQADVAGNDSFPASDPPSHSGITGIRRKPAAAADAKPDSRPPPHQRGQESRPTGQPTWDRHSTETAHTWEDEDLSRRPGAAPPGKARDGNS